MPVALPTIVAAAETEPELQLERDLRRVTAAAGHNRARRRRSTPKDLGGASPTVLSTDAAVVEILAGQRRLEGELSRLAAEVRGSLFSAGDPRGPGEAGPREGSGRAGRRGEDARPADQEAGPDGMEDLDSLALSPTASFGGQAGSKESGTCGVELGFFLSEDSRRGELLPMIGSHMTSGGFVAYTLPRNWPSSLKMRDLGENGSEEIGLDVSPSQMEVRLTESPWNVDSYRSCWQTFGGLIIDPNSYRSMVYDVFCLLILVYDLTMLPLILAWDIQLEGTLQVLATAVLVFWTVDIPKSLLTSTYVDGVLVRDLGWVMRNYLKTWFAIDSLTVLCDWLAVLLGSMTNSVRVIRIAKMVRFLRILGILRMLRFVRVMEEVADWYLPESHHVAMRITKLLVGSAWCVHLLSCTWFAIGTQGISLYGVGWIDELKGADHIYQYVTSYQYVVAQLTLGGIDVRATNSVERLYTVFCLLVGLLFGSALISSLSASLVEMRTRQNSQQDKMRILRRYMRENRVEATLSNLVLRQADERLKQEQPLRERDVTALAILSGSLRLNVRYDIMGEMICTHPLFRLWSRIDLNSLHQVCDTCADIMFLSPLDDLFSAGARANSAFCLISGCLEYAQEPGTSPAEGREVVEVPEGTWLCKAALWSEWIHVGTAVAKTPCKVMRLRSEGVLDVMQMHALIQEVTLQYGKAFQRRLAMAQPPQSSWPTDLEVPFTAFEDLVLSMTKEVQVAIGKHALDVMTGGKAKARRHFMLAKSKDADLVQEVETGRTIVVETGDGQIERVVAVLALNIRSKPEGLTFAQIGRFEADKMTAACKLPGGKQERGEMPNEAVQRLLGEKMPFLAGRVEVERMERSITSKVSQEYPSWSMRSTYLRTVCFAQLRGGIDAKPVRASPHGEAELPEALFQKDVYPLVRDGKADYYAFLDDDEFARFSSGAEDGVLHRWLSLLPAAELQEAKPASDAAECGSEEDFDQVFYPAKGHVTVI